MDPLYISILEHAFSSPGLLGSIPKKTIYILSKVIFDGEGKVSSFDHICHFDLKCRSLNIFVDNEICRLFTLTFKCQIKS